MFGNLQEGFAWAESFSNLEKGPAGDPREYRLDRMEYLAGAFGSPHRDCRVIHVAGSKGKGSVSWYLAGALKGRGLSCGLYTSPHIHSYKERITLAGKEIDDQVFLKNFNAIRGFLDSPRAAALPGNSPPTTFEVITLLAFLVFRDTGCQWAVLETGLGGRLDATNIVTPEAAVITTIELEHTEFLGDTLEKIAREKAGIIKAGRPVFCGLLGEDPARVVEETAREKAAPVFRLSREILVENEVLPSDGKWGKRGNEILTKITWLGEVPRGFRETETWRLKMPGFHQGQNAALAALVLGRLFESRGGFDGEILKTVLEETGLPGRMETFKKNRQTWVLDGAHTPASLALTVKSFLALHGEDGILIFGSVLGKPPAALAEQVLPYFKNIIISRAGHFKPEDPKKVFTVFQEKALEALENQGHPLPNIFIAEEPAKAFLLAQTMGLTDDPVNPREVPDQSPVPQRHRPAEETPRPVLVTGSFYMLDEIRNLLMEKTNAV